MLLPAAAITATGLAAGAQMLADPRNPGTPLIDRGVGDLDQLATSTRRIDPAFGGTPNRDQLFRLQAADRTTGQPGQYLLVSPAFRATFSQPDYLAATPNGIDLNTAAARDGDHFALIPPDTIFHLGDIPTGRPPREPTGPDHRLYRPPPVGDQIDGRWGQAPDLTPDQHGDLPLTNQTPLQPWVTAIDLREARRIDVRIPTHVVMPEQAPLPEPVREGAPATVAVTPPSQSADDGPQPRDDNQ
jgi:hypothetical protein